MQSSGHDFRMRRMFCVYVLCRCCSTEQAILLRAFNKSVHYVQIERDILFDYFASLDAMSAFLAGRRKGDGCLVDI